MFVKMIIFRSDCKVKCISRDDSSDNEETKIGCNDNGECTTFNGKTV